MKFLIVGGDKRTTKLIEMLKNDKHEVKTFGIDNADIKNLKMLKSENISTFDAIIGPIPFTKDGENLNAPLTTENIAICELLPILKNKTFITGPISLEKNKEMEKYNINAIDIMKSEELIVYNTIATAEGAIELAITNTEKNLHESKILILGFGNVAKTLAFKLKGLSKEVTCAARKLKDFAWIDTLGLNKKNINELDENLKEYDIIINTVPHVILTAEKIKNIRKDALVIELASKPGGIDQAAIKESNIKYIFASALPGKVAPISSAEYIKKAIYNIINN